MLRIVFFLSVCASSSMGMDLNTHMDQKRGPAQKNVRLNLSKESFSEIQFPVFTHPKNISLIHIKIDRSRKI